MEDYKKINSTHRLSSYEIKIPLWNGTKNIRRPFESWESNGTLNWYKAYNAAKHDRHSNFEKATFENFIDAICGLVVILSSQFMTHDFSPADWSLSFGGLNDGMESAIGGFFRLKFPSDWPNDEKYEFEWQTLKEEKDPFQTYSY